VQGKTEPVGVYEIMDFYTKDTFPNLRETLDLYKGGLEQYREGRFESAIGAFKQALEQNPKDKLSQIYIDRCNHYLETPPGADWDGVWRLTSK
jgi:adenylate cyclase